jgi:hypothetical protein
VSTATDATQQQTTQRSRSWSLTAPATLPNEQAVAALPCIQHILDANRLTSPDVGLHPDCLFASFIHASQQQEPTCDLITDTRRKCRTELWLDTPDVFFPEAWTKRCNEYSIFKPGLVTTERREGNEHTLRGLAGVYQCRMNIIVVSSNNHHAKTYNPPRNTPSLRHTIPLQALFLKATLPLHHQDSTRSCWNRSCTTCSEAPGVRRYRITQRFGRQGQA